jgi:hypothetical protein
MPKFKLDFPIVVNNPIVINSKAPSFEFQPFEVFKYYYLDKGAYYRKCNYVGKSINKLDYQYFVDTFKALDISTTLEEGELKETADAKIFYYIPVWVK